MPITNEKIWLDIGCGHHLEQGWIGMDIRALDHPKDRFIQHDIREIPWPIDDNACSIVLASHIMEHLSPVTYALEKKFISINDGPRLLQDVKLVTHPGILRFMDELWRVLEPLGQARITGPYGWSHGFVQDPTHAKPLNETLFAYFTPQDWIGNPCGLYEIYKPKPWKWVRVPEYATGGNFIAILETIKT